MRGGACCEHFYLKGGGGASARSLAAALPPFRALPSLFLCLSALPLRVSGGGGRTHGHNAPTTPLLAMAAKGKGEVERVCSFVVRRVCERASERVVFFHGTRNTSPPRKKPATHTQR